MLVSSTRRLEQDRIPRLVVLRAAESLERRDSALRAIHLLCVSRRESDQAHLSENLNRIERHAL
jgi:hypothetical protein